MSLSERPVQTPDVAETSRPPSLVPVTVGVVLGVILALVWSYRFVDGVIGDNTANTLLGYDAKETAIGGAAAGIVFAFVSGLAGTFTACNIAVFGALPQLAGGTTSRARAALTGLGWLTAGMVAVSAGYGFLAVLLGDRLPQLSDRVLSNGVPVRLVQSFVVFGLIGLAFVYLGLCTLGVVPDPFARRPRARLVTLGALIGGFLVGRPYPLFDKLLEYAAETRNPLYGALALTWQSLGNVLLVAVLAGAIALVAHATSARRAGRPRRPERAVRVAGVALIALGTFLVVYWDVRVPSMFGFGAFPTMPWN
ncbi:hypothetical protein [Couchioplanes azureus]|uniref:hypothetical protein n=1 Tax=Couchioplanes caeruleus TaxID=56438 RepID=UPI0016701854|nr:hypothetical protein [Couchioplanes caeruleus]GGQ49114.1 hypothetical protein GCM10010166_16840 [Couchioplanes caeruleus subsp. azureus]